MDHKEMIARVTRQLFWIERVGFLILALTWSLRDQKFELGFISYNWYLESVKYFQLFWMCTNCLYFLVYVSKKQSGSSFRQPVQKSKKVVAELLMIGNPGFLLERFALLFWALSSKHRDTCLLVIFPLLNIYSAWSGYSGKFQQNDTIIFKEESHDDQENSMDRVVFWVERLGFFILSGSWYFSGTKRKFVGWELFRKCMSRWNIMFWLLTNTLYLLTYVDRNGKVLNNFRKNPNFWTSEMNKYFKSHPGFWLERLAISGFAFGLTNFLSLPESQSPASWRMLLELYFSVVFPVLNVYFSWVGYSKEFKKRDTSAVKKFVNITEDHGDFKVNSDDSSAASTIASVLRNILRNQKEMIDKMQEYQKFVVKSKESLKTINQDCSVPYAYVEDLLGKIEDLNIKLVDAMQKNHQEYLVKYEDWWDMMLNGLFKEHEEKNGDYKNVETQYSLLPMNDEVEDYKFVADKEEGKDIESDELDDWDDLLDSDSIRFD